MKKLHRILIMVFFIFHSSIVLANTNPFSYTSTGIIPSITLVDDHCFVTYTIISQIALSIPISVIFKASSDDFTIDNHCKNILLPNGGSCKLVLDFEAKELGPHTATLFVKDEEFNILNITMKSTVD